MTPFAALAKLAMAAADNGAIFSRPGGGARSTLVDVVPFGVGSAPVGAGSECAPVDDPATTSAGFSNNAPASSFGVALDVSGLRIRYR